MVAGDAHSEDGRGTDVTVVAGWIKQVTADRNAATARIAAARQSTVLAITAYDIRAELDRICGLLPLLKVSDPKRCGRAKPVTVAPYPAAGAHLVLCAPSDLCGRSTRPECGRLQLGHAVLLKTL